MADRFTAAGRPEDEADAAGAMIEAFYGTAARQLGVPMSDLVSRFGLPEVRAADVMPENAAAQTLAQAGRDTPDQMMLDAESEGVRLELSPVKDGMVELWAIDARSAGLGQGLGTKYMNRVIDWADANGLRVALTPDDDYGASSIGRLKQFYKRFGFVENKGKKRDFSTQQSMIREPRQTLNQSAPGNPAFDAWFGDSQVVDAEGKPLVVYHGTDTEQFDAFGGQPFFIDNERIAQTYGNRVEPVYLRMENPMVLDAKGKSFLEFAPSAFIAKAKKAGHDGIIVKNIVDDADGSVTEPATDYLTFDPTQIKSVHNRGTFDPSDPRILFQPAYHGTPHIFDKLELSDRTLGTGQGMAAFGAGINLASRKALADHFRMSLAGVEVGFPDGTRLPAEDGTVRDVRNFAVRSLLDDNQDYARAIEGIDDLISGKIGGTIREKPSAYTLKFYKDAQALLREWQSAGAKLEPKGGRTLKVDIPEDAELLEWRTDLADHSPEMQAKVIAAMQSIEPGFEPPRDRSIMAIYTDMTLLAQKRGAAPGEAQRVVSAALRDAGIPGHRYDAGDGTNYVIYDTSRLNVTGFEQPARGAIQFGDTGSIITLLKTADASTALHESAHHFLHMFKSMAEQPEAPLALARDWEVVKSWWGDNADAVAADSPAAGVTGADVRAVLETGTSGDRIKDLAINVGLQEQWARGFERYAADGAAPTEGLRAVFAQFKDWLAQVYRSLTDLRVEVSPEVRGVFDRLLGKESAATEAEPGLFSPALDMQKPAPEPRPDGVVSAAARVGKPEEVKALAEQFAVKEDGSFDEQADIDQMRKDGRLTPEDEAVLAFADQTEKDAGAYAEALRAAAACVAR